jgi:hypothetical protein
MVMRFFAAAASPALNEIADKLIYIAIDDLWDKTIGGSTNAPVRRLNPPATARRRISTSVAIPCHSLQMARMALRVAGQIVGQRGPEIMNVPKGAQIFPNGNFPVNDNAPVNVFLYAPVYNVTCSGEDIDRLRAQMATDRANFAFKTIATVKRASCVAEAQ